MSFGELPSKIMTVLGILHGSRAFGGPVQANLRLTNRCNILRLMDKELKKALSQGIEPDYKSQLQELIQARHQQTPTYQVIEVMGPDHDRRFTVEVRVGDAILGIGSGKSKKLAEAEAARSALDQLPTDFTP